MKLPIPEKKPAQVDKNTQAQTIHQTAAPHDAPPPLPPSNLKTPPIKDKPVTMRTSSGSLSKILGILLVVAIILVLSVVGYLFYQNQGLKNDTTIKENFTPTILPTSSAPTPDQTNNWITYRSEILPISLRLPAGWELSESENEGLGNQKTVNFYSPEFEYGEGGIIAGYQLLIGPYTELADKYDSFEELSKVENADNSAATTTYQEIQWLKYPKSAKTLYKNIPLNAAIYSNDADSVQAEYLFNLILPSLKLTDGQS